MRNGPKTNIVYDLPPNSPVLIWREGNIGQAGHQDGLYNLLTVKGEICTIKLPSRPISFHFTVVKPYLRLKLTKEPTFYDAIEHIEPVQIDKSTPPLQDTAP